MKIIDKYLIKAFIPPFFVAFGIALFVLVMQFLWVYIDEIMGKGLNIFDISELLFYLSMTMVPLALPIGVLISTVMVMGNLAERYELSSFKSAGVGLVRVMRPLAMAVGAITIFSIFASEKVIPWANLKFYSRFYDIRKSKPTVTMQDGVFNDEFQDYTIRIGKKAADGRGLQNVLIYGNKANGASIINQSVAKNGEMYTTSDKQFIVMNLFDGTQFQETTNSNNGKQTYPFVRIKFKSWQKVFDLTQFERKQTDETLFTNHQKMKSSSEMLHIVDSIGRNTASYYLDLERNIKVNYTPLKFKNDIELPPSSGVTNVKFDSVTLKKMKAVSDSINAKKTADSLASTPSVKDGKKSNLTPLNWSKNAQKTADSLLRTPSVIDPKTRVLDSIKRVKIAEKATENSIKKVAAVINFRDTQSMKKLPKNFYDIPSKIATYEFVQVYNSAQQKVKDLNDKTQSTMSQLQSVKDAQGRFMYEMNMKYNYAIICFVFLFIGAPMGAIIQKGGFGMPILIAILFFMVYMVANIYCKNLKETHDISYVMGAWMPVLIMLPIAVFLTYRAVNDYKMIKFDPANFIKKLNPKNVIYYFKTSKISQLFNRKPTV